MSAQQKVKELRLSRRKRRVRKRVFGTQERPRLTVHRSLQHIYAQIVDDGRGVTLCQASTRDKELRGGVSYGGNCPAAAEVGKLLAARAKAAGVERIAFDRNGRRYHGRVKALAEAMRESGMQF
jgi:large subunit ribosomal protein L18